MDHVRLLYVNVANLLCSSLRRELLLSQRQRTRTTTDRTWSEPGDTLSLTAPWPPSSSHVMVQRDDAQGLVGVESCGAWPVAAKGASSDLQNRLAVLQGRLAEARYE